MALLKVENLTVTQRGVPLLEDISFAIGKGQRLGVIGEAGSGKSLLALAILGLLPPGVAMTGSMAFDDKPMPSTEVERAQLRGKRIGAVLEGAADALAPLRTVGAQIGEALRRAAVTGDVVAQTTELLRDVALDPKMAARYPRDLTAPERQRAMFAIAIAAKPELLIVDEPAAGLDLIGQRRILDLINRLCTEHNLSLLVISHDLKTVAMLATKVVVLRGGKVVEAGEKPEVFGHPRHEFTRAMLSAGRHRARTLMRTPIGGTLLELRNVTRRFRTPDRSLFEPQAPVTALDDVSFALRAGESLAVIGPAGSGKSTLTRIIVGLERATSGELEFDQSILYRGTDMPRAMRQEVGYVFRDPAATFNPRYTVGESIAEPLQLELQKSIDELGGRIVEVVTAVGLHPDMLGRLPREFTIGQLQRLAIARALVTRPKLMVLDDPVAALDIAARGEILVLLNRLRADFGLSFLVTCHDLDVVRIIADRVIVLDKGRVVETTTPAQLLEKPQHATTQQLVAAQLPDVGIVPVF